MTDQNDFFLHPYYAHFLKEEERRLSVAPALLTGFIAVVLLMFCARLTPTLGEESLDWVLASINGAQTEGVVNRRYEATDAPYRFKKWTIEYSFVANGKSYHSQTYLDRHSKLSQGAPVSVSYSPANPGRSVVKEVTTLGSVLANLLSLLLLWTGALLFVYLTGNTWRNRQLALSGTIVSGRVSQFRRKMKSKGGNARWFVEYEFESPMTGRTVKGKSEASRLADDLPGSPEQCHVIYLSDQRHCCL